MAPTTPRSPRFVQAPAAEPDRGLGDLAAGLLRDPAQVAPKYFYDRLGSALFDAITELPEYYPTRTEAAIFAAHGSEIAAALGAGATLIDLGAGNCAKASRLIPLLDPRRYIAVDISADHLQDALRWLQREHAALDITGVGMDFSRSAQLPAGLVDTAAERPVFFYPGSSIGNFTPDEALAFLRGVRAQAERGGLLIGVDLVKPVDELEAAYDDPLGVTAAFNLNLLRNVNRALGSDFAPRQWRHLARFDTARSRIEMHLEAREGLVVAWPGGARRFARGERIHTENSYKYHVDAFAALLRDAGFAGTDCWTDPRHRFAVFFARG
jgi:dimethylhistidine N-methyltransferase